MSAYAAALAATKQHYPFAGWMSYEDLEQYNEETCGAATEIFDRLISDLVALGAQAHEKEKLGAFRRAVEALNELNDENMGSFIETGEAEELCGLCNIIALAAGLDPEKYGGGEGPASEWRDW